MSHKPIIYSNSNQGQTYFYIYMHTHIKKSQNTHIVLFVLQFHQFASAGVKSQQNVKTFECIIQWRRCLSAHTHTKSMADTTSPHLALGLVFSKPIRNTRCDSLWLTSQFSKYYNIIHRIAISARGSLCLCLLDYWIYIFGFISFFVHLGIELLYSVYTLDGWWLCVETHTGFVSPRGVFPYLWHCLCCARGATLSAIDRTIRTQTAHTHTNT